MNLRLSLTHSTLTVEFSHEPEWPGVFLDLVARHHADLEAHRSGYIDAGMPVRTELVDSGDGQHRTRWLFLLPRATLIRRLSGPTRP